MESNNIIIAKDFIKWHIFRSSEGELSIPQNGETSHEALFAAICELEKEGLIFIKESFADRITIKLKRDI
jgi:hypothetical protein